jgi:hypothetical protein
MGLYIIKYAQNPNFALGISDQQSGAKLVLLPVSGTSTRKLIWNVNLDDFSITLWGSGGTLAIDIGGGIQDTTPLILNTYKTGIATQQWDPLSKPGFILSVPYMNFCIDDDHRQTASGTQVWLYTFNGSPAQQWSLISLSNASLAAE